MLVFMDAGGAGGAAGQIQAHLSRLRAGSLRVFGDWFGRPYDNQHVVVAAEASGDDLVVTFNEDECLVVTSPEGWEFNERVFCIRRGRRVIWRWYSYGLPKVPHNLYTIEHRVNERGDIEAKSDVDWYQPSFEPDAKLPAAELLGFDRTRATP